MAVYEGAHAPFAETYQNNRWNTNGRFGAGDHGPRRSAPAELPYLTQQHGRWYQGGVRTRNAQPKMYFARPSDGKRSGISGRLMDGLSGEGPDVFVFKCGDKRTLMRDRPQRWQWSGWDLTPGQQDDLRRYDKDFRRKDLFAARELASTGKKRWWHPHYDFRSRKYSSSRKMPRDPREAWTDVRWREGARRNDMLPLCYRDGMQQWYSRVPADAGDIPGGRPRTW